MAGKRFSLKALLALTASVALVLACLRLIQSNAALLRDLDQARSDFAAAENRFEQWRSDDESRFWGENGDPLLLMHLVEPHHTALHRIKNSKYQSVNRTQRVRMDATNLEFTYELRLLRSLDGTDFYLLNYSLGNTTGREVIEYNGDARPVAKSPELILALAGSDEDAFDLLYEQTEDVNLRKQIDSWKKGNGPPPAYELMPSSPAGSRP
ncbi:MAG: hypothetical protein ACE361_24950 [Aureliella sp.]